MLLVPTGNILGDRGTVAAGCFPTLFPPLMKHVNAPYDVLWDVLGYVTVMKHCSFHIEHVFLKKAFVFMGAYDVCLRIYAKIECVDEECSVRARYIEND